MTNGTADDAEGTSPDLTARLASVRGDGDAASGLVRVTLDGTGALVDLRIEPKAMRLGSEDLGAAVVEAFNAARAAVQSELTASEPPFAVTQRDLRLTLDELQMDAERRLNDLTEIAEDLARRVDRLT